MFHQPPRYFLAGSPTTRDPRRLCTVCREDVETEGAQCPDIEGTLSVIGGPVAQSWGMCDLPRLKKMLMFS